MRQVFLDVETKKTFDEVGGYYPEKLEISFTGVIVREGFPEEDAVHETKLELFETDLPKLWRELEHADVIIGFNIIGFDLMALKPYYPGEIMKLPVLDLMVRFKEAQGHRISLDSIAKETLHVGKTGDGLDAIRYFREGKLADLASYCMKDVELTRDIYDWGRVHGKVKYGNKWNEVVEGKVDFSFTPSGEAQLQMSLL